MSLNYAPENFKFIPHTKSFRLNDGISKAKRLAAKQCQIYGYIYSWVESGYYCKVGMVTIAEYLNCSPTTVENAIPRLEKLGWITVVHGKRPEKSAKNACNIYNIKRKPLSTKATKVEKSNVEQKIKKSEVEQKKSKAYGCLKMMKELGMSYSDRKSIKDQLMSLII